MKSPIVGARIANIAAGTTLYHYFFNNNPGLAYNATAANRQTLFSIPGTISNFNFQVATAPGVGNSWTITVMKNNVATAVTCTIADTATTGSDITHTFTVAAGDELSIQTTSSGSPTATGNNYWWADFANGASVGQNLSFSTTASLSNSVTRYAYLSGVTGTDTVTTVANIMPTAGVLANLYVKLSAAPGASTSYSFEIFKNGSSTGVTCSVANAATTSNDTTHTVSVVAGDLVNIKIIPTNTPGSAFPEIAVNFQPTIDGEAILVNSQGGDVPPANATNYDNLLTDVVGWGAEAGAVMRYPGVLTVSKLYLKVTTAPGLTQSNAMTVRKELASTALTATISGAATTANDTTHTFSTVSGDRMAMQAVISVAAASADNFYWGFVAQYPSSYTSHMGLLGVG